MVSSGLSYLLATSTAPVSAISPTKARRNSTTSETKDQLKRRIDEATAFVDLDRLALSPQCGCASTVEGNLITEQIQRDKLRLVVEMADEVWGHA